MKFKEITVALLPRMLNEHLVLSVINKGQKHGYQIALESKEISGGKIDFKHGTLYPILHKLEKEGYIEGCWQDESVKRKRKYYQITSLGKERIKFFAESWSDFKQQIDNFFQDV